MSDDVEKPSSGERRLRVVFEVEDLRELRELLAPLKHIAYRSDLWLTARGESARTSDNGTSERESLREEQTP